MGQVHDIAAARGLSSIAADGLILARDTFGTVGVEPLVEALRAATPRRPEAIVVQGRGRWRGCCASNLAALPGWRARARLLREHLLPSPSYMRARYRVTSDLLLPSLYRLARARWRSEMAAPADG